MTKCNGLGHVLFQTKTTGPGKKEKVKGVFIDPLILFELKILNS